MAARLLVVDDNDMNREMLRRRFSRAGHEVDAVSGGQGALDLVARRVFDVVLLDIEMPRISGLDVLRSLRARYTAAELPVVMVSARRESSMIIEALELGANDYVTKPVDFAVASARVEALLARRRIDDVTQRTHPLTGLPNRQAIARWWAARSAPDRPVAALWVNLDRFRAINNGLGRGAGDALLVGVAARLRTLSSSESLLVHLEGDDFLFLEEGLSIDAAGALAARVLGALRGPFSLGEHAVTVRASVGVACGSQLTPDDLLAEADGAMYRAKCQSGDRWALFDHEPRLRVVERLRLETEMQRALETGEFEIDYQPIMVLSSNALAGFEVLVRWNHPTRGVIAPAFFIPLAEETGLIRPLGLHVLRLALRQMRRWQEDGRLKPPRGLSVNVSGVQLRDPAWFDSLVAAIEESGADPRGLSLELTESVLFEDIDAIPRLLRRVQALGVQIALDDFGTGYSSLSHLQQFGFDSIKVDRSFVRRIADSGGSEVVRAILHLASTFRLEVVAEGIESVAQLTQLRDLGCGFGQGFFLSKPLGLAAANQLLERQAVPAAD